MADLTARQGAVLSPDGRYRYLLWRDLDRPEDTDGLWGSPRPATRSCLFVMLNPSTADASVDDNTIRRCKGFARREGCDRLEVVNLYAWRATDPDELVAAGEDRAMGPDNWGHIVKAIERARLVICAWGSWWDSQSPRNRLSRVNVEAEVARQGKTAFALGLTKTGQPRHPLYVKGDAPLVEFL